MISLDVGEDFLEFLLANPMAVARTYQTSPPEFLFNDPEVCCLLRSEEQAACPGVNKGYLGKRGKVGVPYLVEINDLLLILKTTRPGNLSLVYREEPPTSIKKFEQTLDQAPSKCGYPNLDDLRYLGADEFTNEMLIGLILDAYFTDVMNTSQLSFRPYVRYYTSSICKDGLAVPIGVHLIEYADLGTLVDFAESEKTKEYRETKAILDPRSRRGDRFTIEVVKEEWIWVILRQVISALDLLQKDLAFNHGDLKAANIFVSSEPASGQYEGVSVEAPFTCKIADYGKSSLTLQTEMGPHRIYNRTWLADRYLYLIPFTPSINRDRDDGDFFVVQGLLTVHLYTRTRHMGIPFYLAFDTYTFLISILSIPAYYYAFFTNSDLVDIIWNPLWFGNDAQVMQSKILALHQDPNKAMSLTSTLDLLRGVRLRCDATTRLLQAVGGL